MHGHHPGQLDHDGILPITAACSVPFSPPRQCCWTLWSEIMGGCHGSRSHSKSTFAASGCSLPTAQGAPAARDLLLKEAPRTTGGAVPLQAARVAITLRNARRTTGLQWPESAWPSSSGSAWCGEVRAAQGASQEKWAAIRGRRTSGVTLLASRYLHAGGTLQMLGRCTGQTAVRQVRPPHMPNMALAKPLPAICISGWIWLKSFTLGLRGGHRSELCHMDRAVGRQQNRTGLTRTARPAWRCRLQDKMDVRRSPGLAPNPGGGGAHHPTRTPCARRPRSSWA